jgi:hypothetical protein
MAGGNTQSSSGQGYETNQSNSGMIGGQIPENFNWDRFMQELNTTSETLQGYTQKGFQAPGDQNQRLTDASYCIEQCRQLLTVPEVQQTIQNVIQQHSGGSLSQGATAGSARSGPNPGQVQT